MSKIAPQNQDVLSQSTSAPLSPGGGEDVPLPDHTQLPDSDGSIVQNSLELPQTIMLTDSIRPVLQRLFPDERYFIGQDCGIYWRLTEPVLRGAVSPDWYLVPNVPSKLKGLLRRSYVLWQELVSPSIIIEYVSGDGSEERDRTPNEGKFWIYEQVVQSAYYAIHDAFTETLEVHRRDGGKFKRLKPNEEGRFKIEPLGVQLGMWQGKYLNFEATWARWYDAQGQLLEIGAERADREQQRAEREKEHAKKERKRAKASEEKAQRLAERLRSLGVDPDQV